MIKFEACGADPEVGKLYRLIIDGRTVRENLTIDDVVRAINARDEARLGMDHAPRAAKAPSERVPRGTDCRASVRTGSQ